MELTSLSITDKNTSISSGNYNIIPMIDGAIFEVKENSEIYLLLQIEKDTNVSFDIKKSAKVIINVINIARQNNSKINAIVDKSANIQINIADFSSGNSSFKCLVDLKDVEAKCNIHLATVSKNNDEKIFEINSNHLSKETSGKVECYGVAKNSSKLVFSGFSNIKKNSIKSSTNQIAKAMIFDENAVANAKPVLCIDENDVIASHSAAVGRINEEHIFYLTSRGLSVEEAREIITLGYLKPIINKFDEENKEKILSLIERSI